MDDVERQALEAEVLASDRYAAIWDDPVSGLFERKQAELYQAFIASPSTDPQRLVEIRMQVNALLWLKSEFTCIMDSGKLAKFQLEKEQ